MRLKEKIFLFVIIGMGITFNCLARSSTSKKIKMPFYLRIDGGTSIINSTLDKLDYDNKKSPSKSGFYGIGLGYIINEKFRTDILVSHRVNYKFNLHSKTKEGDDKVISQNFNNIALIANLYYTIFQKNIFYPYLNIGFGFANNYSLKYKKEFVDINNGSPILRRTAPSTNQFNLIYNIGGGLNIRLNKKFFFDLNYKYIDLGNLGKATYTEMLGQKYSSSPGEFMAHEFAVSVIYKF